LKAVPAAASGLRPRRGPVGPSAGPGRWGGKPPHHSPTCVRHAHGARLRAGRGMAAACAREHPPCGHHRGWVLCNGAAPPCVAMLRVQQGGSVGRKSRTRRCRRSCPLWAAAAAAVAAVGPRTRDARRRVWERAAVPVAAAAAAAAAAPAAAAAGASRHLPAEPRRGASSPAFASIRIARGVAESGRRWLGPAAAATSVAGSFCRRLVR